MAANDTAFIVGAGRGLSASLGRLLEREGFNVALAARNPDKLETKGLALRCDATDRAQVEAAFEAVEAYAKLAKRRGLTLTQLALGYVRSRWFVGSTIIGATSMAQLAEDIDAFVDLDASTLAEIAAIQVHYPNPSH